MSARVCQFCRSDLDLRSHKDWCPTLFAADAIEKHADDEAARTEWDGKPGLLGNWIDGIRDGARLVRGEIR